MYFASILLFLLVLPLASVAIDASIAGHTAPILALVGKWFVFWSVGVRLLTAGARQVLQPGFTAQEIFYLSDPGSLPLVREIGFGNLSMGLLGLLSLLQSAWVVPAAITGGLYYGLAAVGHLLQSGRNSKENAAMISDVFIFLVLLVFVLKTLA